MDRNEFVKNLLGAARGYVGIDRDNNRFEITRFLNLLGLDFADTDGTPYSYCACFVAWCLCHAYCDTVGIPYTAETAPEVFQSVLPQIKAQFCLPSASCGAMMDYAKEVGTWLADTATDHSEILPGYIVIYDWLGDGTERHTGIVVFAEDDLHTIEGNTSGDVDGDQVNGGVVAEKVRDYSQAVGFIKILEPSAHDLAVAEAVATNHPIGG